MSFVRCTSFISFFSLYVSVFSVTISIPLSLSSIQRFQKGANRLRGWESGRWRSLPARGNEDCPNWVSGGRRLAVFLSVWLLLVLAALALTHSQWVFNHSYCIVLYCRYIGMLAVSQSYRRRGIGKALVKRVVQRMKKLGCTSVTLETEVSNKTAQKLYENAFGFIREELLVRYYLNFGDAYRLRLWF